MIIKISFYVVLNLFVVSSLMASAESTPFTKLWLEFVDPRTARTTSLRIYSQEDEAKLKHFFEELFLRAPTPIEARVRDRGPEGNNTFFVSNETAQAFVARQNSIAGDLLVFTFSASSYGFAQITISPAIRSREDLGNRTTRVAYKNGIVDEITTLAADFLGKTIRRHFPDGSLEAGENLGGPHFSGYRERGERISFHTTGGDLLTEPNSEGLYFIISPKDGKIVLLEPNADGVRNSYQLSYRDPVDWLLKSLLPNGPKGRISSHLDLALTSILTSDNKIAQFYRGIFSSNWKSLSNKVISELLAFAREKNFTIPWTLAEEQTTFLRLLQESVDDVKKAQLKPVFEAGSKAVTLMLEANAELATLRNAEGKTALAIALSGGTALDARAIIAALDRIRVEQSAEDKLYRGAFSGAIDLTDDEIMKLPDEWKNMVYRIANLYDQRDLVARLNRLGMRQQGYAIRHDGMSLLHPTMDAITVQKTLFIFLKNLRAQKRLLRDEEFQEKVLYREKGDIGRLIGADLIAQTARRLGVDHIIKVPNKIAVINPGLDEIALQIVNNAVQTPVLSVQTTDVIVYARNVYRYPRMISLDEMSALMRVCKEAGYADIWPANFIVTNDSIYFIDTEYKSLNMWQNPGNFIRLKSMLDEKDHAAFSAMVQDEVQQALTATIGERYRRGRYYPSSAEDAAAKSRKLEVMMPSMHYNGLDTRLMPFRFKVDELIDSVRRTETLQFAKDSP